ncbi:MAG: DUF1800 domain-containing protein [Ferruginibacter sp.]|nr:DUF1800 domain-containing protein [Cytophagales bacterium]
MDRRDFLRSTIQPAQPKSKPEATIPRSASRAKPSARVSGDGLALYTGPWGTDQVIHLLRRTTFGATKRDVDLLKGELPWDAVHILLTAPSEAPEPPLNNYYNATYQDPTGVQPGTTWVTAPYGDGTVDSRRTTSFKSWWTGQMLNQSASIQEKMTLFWHNHFATATQTVGDARYVYQHNALLRSYALGNFKELTKKVTVDPAMLRYLNGYVSTKTAPDENYARELQELFTLGKGPDSNYTEDDVKAAARVLTGWRDSRTNINTYFDATRHDTTNKQFSSFYNDQVIQGRTGAAGAREVDDLVDMIFAQPEVAKFLCRRLYRWFVHYTIDEGVEENVITPLADILRNNDYEIRPVLFALFNSAHFFAADNVGGAIKNPIDYCVGLCRQFDVVFPGGNSVPDQYRMWDYLRFRAASMQMNLADPPNVAGWPAYWQEPGYYEIWINSDTLPKRVRLADTLISTTGYRNGNVTLIIDPLKFVAQFSNPGDPNLLVSDLIAYLFAISVSDEQKDVLKKTLLSGQTNDYYWTNAWVAYQTNPGDAMNRNIVRSRLQSLLKYLLDIAEYQLC